MTKPYARLDSDLIAVPKEDLRILVEDVEGGWDDHSYAKTEDNPGWQRVKVILSSARNAIGRAR